MKPVESSEIESLLSQLKLKAPSAQLDDSVSRLAKTSSVELVAEPGTAAFGWPALIATALVAAIGGLLVGTSYSANFLGRADTNVAVKQTTTDLMPDRSKITPVKFSVQAYEILHGHSTNSAFADCGACHQEEDDEEAFEGWFYGNDDFFESHRDGTIGKCVSCHVRASQPKSEQLKKSGLGENFQHRDFPNANCSSCHGKIGDVPKIAQPEAEFHHHFEGVENCSNCHVVGSEQPAGNGRRPHENVSDCSSCHLVNAQHVWPRRNLGHPEPSQVGTAICKNLTNVGRQDFPGAGPEPDSAM